MAASPGPPDRKNNGSRADLSVSEKTATANRTVFGGRALRFRLSATATLPQRTEKPGGVTNQQFLFSNCAAAVWGPLALEVQPVNHAASRRKPRWNIIYDTHPVFLLASSDQVDFEVRSQPWLADHERAVSAPA
jgi:hypothetical protein